ncbi:Vacuolar ATPase assembly integral membrane protein vma21, partial [Orchesella cincta]
EHWMDIAVGVHKEDGVCLDLLSARQSTQITVYSELFVPSMCMFTLPFVSYFGTQHFLKEYYPLYADSGWDVFLPVLSSVVTVWIVISVYMYRAFQDPENLKEDNDKLSKKGKLKEEIEKSKKSGDGTRESQISYPGDPEV